VTPLWRFLARRLIATLVVLLIVFIGVFSLTRLTGDPVDILAGDSATDENKQQLRVDFGLDRPVLEQFGIWLDRLAHGDLGESFYYRRKVTELIAQRLEKTVALALSTILLAVIVAIPLGVLAAWRHGGWFDRALMGFSTLGFSVPVFVLGYLLIWLLAVTLHWLPPRGYEPLAGGLGPFLEHLILPSVTLSLVYIALIARVTRTAVSEALTEEYIRTARAKGLHEVRILFRHALANAAAPIVTVIGIGLATLLGGVVVTEHVFGIAGLGDLAVTAVGNRDFGVIQAVILLFSFTYVVVNFAIDVSYVLLDPRVRY
jgi:peptide/nickel transport system permease protein